MQRERAAGKSLAAIADGLNAAGVPQPHRAASAGVSGHA